MKEALQTLVQLEQQPPSYEEWSRLYPLQLAPDSPRNLKQLYEDIYKLQELRLIAVYGVLKLWGKAVILDVYYEGERKYKLHETRLTLLSGKTIEDYLNGDKTAVTPSAPRPTTHSLSERMRLEGEEPRQAMIRGIREELFTYGTKGCLPDSYLETVLENQLTHIQHHHLERGPNAAGKSYAGIPSVHDWYCASITFTPEMRLPIDEIDGVPQPLYEYIPERGYLNVFKWEELPDQG
ncbi:hypothetical protein HGA88_05060 [Candidatus Roizmanbacteria bacterium]|nr:hypothetical protein [Candidatus Roizmanbacteria bacterium]